MRAFWRVFDHPTLGLQLVTDRIGPLEVLGLSRGLPLFQQRNSFSRDVGVRLFADAKRSEGDQALVDMALYSCDKCMKLDGLSIKEREHVGSARVHLVETGGAPIADASVDPAGDGFGLAAKAGSSRSRAHQNLMDIAHECIGKVIGERAPNTGAWHSEETIYHL